MIILKNPSSKAVLAAVALMAMNIPTASHATSLITDISTQGLRDTLSLGDTDIDVTTLENDLATRTCPENPDNLKEIIERFKKAREKLIKANRQREHINRGYQHSLDLGDKSLKEANKNIARLERELKALRENFLGETDSRIKFQLISDIRSIKFALDRWKSSAEGIKARNDELERKLKENDRLINRDRQYISLIDLLLPILEACRQALEKPPTGGTTGENGNIRK